MKKTIFLLCGIFLATYISGQNINDKDLVDKQLTNLQEAVTKNLQENILPYWTNNLIDNINGGFYGRIDGNEKLYKDDDRGGILNARILWTFSSAFRVPKDSAYLTTATHAKDYILNHFIDRQFGGTFRSVDAQGNPSDTRKQTYSQAFFIYALSEYYRATGDQKALVEARAIFDCLEKYSFDIENNGYFEVFSRDWKKNNDLLIGEKNKTDQKTMNTHLHLMEAYANLYRVWPDKNVAERLKNLVELFTEKIIDPQTAHLIVFMDKKWKSTSTIFSYGHDIEASWLFVEAANLLGEQKLISTVKIWSIKIVDVAAEGIQPDGSLIAEKDYATGHLNLTRDWWPQAEAIVGFTNAYKLSGDTKYLNYALNSWTYTNNNMVDHHSGEWYNSVSENGKVNMYGDKAGFWKCPYHNGRMCMEIIERTRK